MSFRMSLTIAVRTRPGARSVPRRRARAPRLSCDENCAQCLFPINMPAHYQGAGGHPVSLLVALPSALSKTASKTACGGSCRAPCGIAKPAAAVHGHWSSLGLLRWSSYLSFDVYVLVQRSLGRADRNLLAVREDGSLNRRPVSDCLFGRHVAVEIASKGFSQERP